MMTSYQKHRSKAGLSKADQNFTIVTAIKLFPLFLLTCSLQMPFTNCIAFPWQAMKCHWNHRCALPGCPLQPKTAATTSFSISSSFELFCNRAKYSNSPSKFNFNFLFLSNKCCYHISPNIIIKSHFKSWKQMFLDKFVLIKCIAAIK